MKKIFLIILVFSAFFCKAQNLPFYFPAPYDAVKGMYYQPIDSIQLLWKTSPTYATRYYINTTDGNTAISFPYFWELDYLAYTTTQTNPVMTNYVVTGSIHDVMTFNTILTATQITNLYNWTNNNLGYSNKH